MSGLAQAVEQTMAPLLSDRMWLEANCMLFRISEDDVKRLLHTFILHGISGGEDFNLKTVQNIKFHFRSYLYKMTPDERASITDNNIPSVRKSAEPGCDFDHYAQMLRQGEGSDSALW